MGCYRCRPKLDRQNMSWARYAIKQLQAGKAVSVRASGNSMIPRIKSGTIVEIGPVSFNDLKKGDVVLVRLKGRDYLHLISAIDGDRVQISNNHGHVNGWARRTAIYGKAKA